MADLTLNIQKFKVNRYSENRAVLADNSKLNIAITLPSETGIFVYCYTNNNERGTVEFKSGETIEVKNPTFGTLTSYITQTVKGTTVARYEIEPLTLVSGGLDGQPVIIANPSLSSEIEKVTKDYTAKTDDLTKQLNAKQEQINRLVDVVYTLYSHDLEVDEISEEDFKKKIKGGENESDTKSTSN